MLVHASCIAVDGHGVLLRGPSGSGKSDLALRLIDTGAALVADDQVLLETGRCDSGDTLLASAPAALSGLLEVRGIGIITRIFMEFAPLRLVIDLDANATIERLPCGKTCSFLGIDLPCLALNPFEASAPAKVRIGVKALFPSAEP